MPNFPFLSWLLKLVVHKSRSKNILMYTWARVQAENYCSDTFYLYIKSIYQALHYIWYGLCISVKSTGLKINRINPPPSSTHCTLGNERRELGNQLIHGSNEIRQQIQHIVSRLYKAMWMTLTITAASRKISMNKYLVVFLQVSM